MALVNYHSHTCRVANNISHFLSKLPLNIWYICCAMRNYLNLKYTTRYELVMMANYEIMNSKKISLKKDRDHSNL